jgi:hypothetical protein
VERRGATVLSRLFRRLRPHRNEGFVIPAAPRSVRHLNSVIAELSELRAAIADSEEVVTLLALDIRQGKSLLTQELACRLAQGSAGQSVHDPESADWVVLARVFDYLTLQAEEPSAELLDTTASTTPERFLAVYRLAAALGAHEMAADAVQAVCSQVAVTLACHTSDLYVHSGALTVSRPLTPELRAGLLRLIDGIRSVLCLMKVRVISGLSRDPPALHMIWAMLAPSRFGDRGDPDDHSLPAFMPMSVVAEAARSA